jgi:hypothetical protein
MKYLIITYSYGNGEIYKEGITPSVLVYEMIFKDWEK